MFWRSLVLALFVVAVYAQKIELTENSVEQLKSLFRNQCNKTKAEDKFDDVANSVQTFIDCVKGLVDGEQLYKEIEEAKPNGALDEVFKKYCAKSPQLKTCIRTVLEGISPCLETEQKDIIPSAINGTDQLIDFVCHKDGDRIALFISEKGPECFDEQKNAIRECFSDIQSSVASSEAAKTVPERCTKYDVMSSCVVTALESCDTPTPANMAESLFKFVRKSGPCNTALPPAKD